METGNGHIQGSGAETEERRISRLFITRVPEILGSVADSPDASSAAIDMGMELEASNTRIRSAHIGESRFVSIMG